MRYKLTTTQENGAYNHTLTVISDSCERVIPWNKRGHRGANARMINAYAKFNETQLAIRKKRRGLEKITNILEIK